MTNVKEGRAAVRAFFPPFNVSAFTAQPLTFLCEGVPMIAEEHKQEYRSLRSKALELRSCL
jgi:hypothetical protein